MGWWTDLKNIGSKVEGAVALGVDAIAPGAGAYVKQAADAVGHIGDSIRDAGSAGSGGAPLTGPPPGVDPRRWAAQQVPPNPGLDLRNTPPTADVMAGIQALSGVPMDVQSGKANAVPYMTIINQWVTLFNKGAPSDKDFVGLKWNATTKQYEDNLAGWKTLGLVDAKGVLTGKKFAVGAQPGYQPPPDQNDGLGVAEGVLVRRRRMWLWVGGGVAAALLAAALVWYFSSRDTRKAA